MVTKNKKKAKT